MPRQAERTQPSSFDSFTDVRVSIAPRTHSASQDDEAIFNNDDDLDEATRDRLGLLRRGDDFEGGNIPKSPVSAGGGMRQGKPFYSLSINRSSFVPTYGAIYSSEQSQQTMEILQAQDEALDKLSANLGRLQNVSSEITSEMTAQELVVQEVSSIAERAENAVNDVTRQVEVVVKKYNAESWIPRFIWVLLVVVFVELFYLVYF